MVRVAGIKPVKPIGLDPLEQLSALFHPSHRRSTILICHPHVIGTNIALAPGKIGDKIDCVAVDRLLIVQPPDRQSVYNGPGMTGE